MSDDIIKFPEKWGDMVARQTIKDRVRWRERGELTEQEKASQ